MSDEERLKWLKEIEKDIFVCSLESTFVEDAKSCAIHSAIETLENQKTGHWIKHEKSNVGKCMKISYECSNCKVWMGCEYFIRKSYCPNCGAKMEGE